MMMAKPRIMMIAFAVIISLTAMGQPARAGADPGVIEVQSMIVDAALAFDVDPALALAMAEIESAFDPKALSHAGARGVMQIMPATAKGEYGLHPDILWDPKINIRVGVEFIRRLLDRYQGQEKFALSWYNGGSRVGPLHRAKVIPATAAYVDKVLRAKRRYTRRIAKDGLRAWLQPVEVAGLE